MSSYLLAVDSSNQGTKTSLYDNDLKQIGAEFEEANILTPQSGVAFQETDDLMGAVRRTIERLMSDTGISADDIAAIAVSGQMGGIIGIKEDGSAATYYDSWYDTRCGKYAEEMREKAGKSMTEITGSPVLYTHGPKILWWKNEKPDVYASIAKFVTLHAYIVMQMCGLAADDAYLDYTCIQYSGFGDNLKKEWSDQLLELFDVPRSKMPKIVAPTDIIGKTSAAFAESCGLKEGIPVIAGMGSTAASMFGSGMTEPGKVHDWAGTANVLAGVIDEYRPDTEFETVIQMRSPVDGTWYPMIYIAGGGLALRWYKETLAGFPAAQYSELDHEAEDVPAGSLGVMFFPMFSGLDLAHGQDVKACFTGLNWTDSRAHLYRAVMEGVAYEYSQDIEKMRRLLPELDYSELISEEGAARSNIYNQIKADVLGMTVRTTERNDSALLGDAAIAKQAGGKCDKSASCESDTYEVIETFTPDSKNAAVYTEGSKAYARMLPALQTMYRAQAVQEIPGAE